MRRIIDYVDDREGRHVFVDMPGGVFGDNQPDRSLTAIIGGHGALKSREACHQGIKPFNRLLCMIQTGNE
jgi:hypothetical protein